MSSILPLSRPAPAASSKSSEPGQASHREVGTMFAAVYGTLKEPVGSSKSRAQPTNESHHRGRTLLQTRFPLALMTRLAQQATQASQRAAQALGQATAQGVTPALVRTVRTQVLRARRAADLALQGHFQHAAAARRAPGNEALRDTAEAVEIRASEALDATASANVSYGGVLVLDSGRDVADARAAALRSQGLLNDVLGQAADQLEAEGGSPEQVAALRILRLEPGALHTLDTRSAALSLLERVAGDLADSGRPGLARRVRGIKSVLQAAFLGVTAFDAAHRRGTTDSMRYSHIMALEDLIADLNPGDLLARQTNVAMLQTEVAGLSRNVDPFAAVRSTPAAVAEARAVAAAQEAGFLPLDPDSGPTAQSIARRHSVDELQDTTLEIEDLAYAYEGLGPGVDDPEVYAQAEALYERLAEQAEALKSGLVATATADAAAAAAEPGNARLAAVAQQSAACLSDWRRAIGNAQSAMTMMRVDAMEGQAFQAVQSAELAHTHAKDALDLAIDALGDAGVPDAVLHAVRGLGEPDANPAAAAGVLAQARGALDALGVTPTEQARLSAVLSRAGDALTAADRSADHSHAAESLTSQAAQELEVELDVNAQDIDPVVRQRDMQTFFERNAGQYASVQSEAVAARAAQESAGRAAQAAQAVGRAGQGTGVSDMEVEVTPAPSPPPPVSPPPPPLSQEAQPLIEAGTQAGQESRAAVEAAVRTHGGADTEAA
ncbi:MAG: hypothetical protein V4739_01380, partial [Pseudomonadota bacterium]